MSRTIEAQQKIGGARDKLLLIAPDFRDRVHVRSSSFPSSKEDLKNIHCVS